MVSHPVAVAVAEIFLTRRHSWMNPTLNIHRHALRLCEFHMGIEEVRTVKASEGSKEKRIIRGYASTNAIDKMGDIVDPQSFKGTISDYMKNGSVLMHHDSRMPIGLPKEFDLSDKGLRIESEMGIGLHPLDNKEQAWNDIEQELVKGLSIGFRILKDEAIDPQSDEGKRGARRKILKLRLFEHSVVTIPAGEGTWFSVAKGLQYGSDAPIDLYERNLWPDERVLVGRKDAMDLYWSGRWPSVGNKSFRSNVEPGAVDETNNEGVEGETLRAAEAAALTVRMALLKSGAAGTKE